MKKLKCLLRGYAKRFNYLLKKQWRLNEKGLIVLEDEGFNLYTDDAIEIVINLKQFIEKNYPEIATLSGFNKVFLENKYNILGATEDLSILSHKHFDTHIVLM